MSVQEGGKQYLDQRVGAALLLEQILGKIENPDPGKSTLGHHIEAVSDTGRPPGVAATWVI